MLVTHLKPKEELFDLSIMLPNRKHKIHWPAISVNVQNLLFMTKTQFTLQDSGTLQTSYDFPCLSIVIRISNPYISFTYVCLRCCLIEYFDNTWKLKGQLDVKDWFFIAKLTVRSTCFGHHYAHHQERKS